MRKTQERIARKLEEDEIAQLEAAKANIMLRGYQSPIKPMAKILATKKGAKSMSKSPIKRGS